MESGEHGRAIKEREKYKPRHAGRECARGRMFVGACKRVCAYLKLRFWGLDKDRACVFSGMWKNIRVCRLLL